MKRYSVQRRYRIFVKGYRFLSLARNMGKNIGENISETLSSNYIQKLLCHAKQSAKIHLKLLQKSDSENTRSNWWFN